MMRWVLLACLAAMASATSEPHTVSLPEDISQFAIFKSKSKAHETTTFTLKQTIITITRQTGAVSEALAAKRPAPKIIVTDAAAKGMVCVAAGKVEVDSAGNVVETGHLVTSGESSDSSSVGTSAAAGGGGAASSAAAGGSASSAAAGVGGASAAAAAGVGASSAAAAGGSKVEGGVEGGVEGTKSGELLVGQGGGLVASVSAAAAASAGAGGASSSAAGHGAAASSAAGQGSAASSAAGQGSAASSAAGQGSAASSAAGQGSAASSAAGQGSAASSAAGQGGAASSAAGQGAAASSAAGSDTSAASAAGAGGASTSTSGESTSSSSISSEGEMAVEVSGGGEAAASYGGESIHLSGSGEVKHIDERFCICVPSHLCNEDGFINTSGEGVIDIRTFTKTTKKRAYASKCTTEQACCRHRKNEQIGWVAGSCGYRSPIPLDRRVVGGEASGLGRFPWMVAIIRSVPDGPDQYVCGGSLIRENVVLTGAHCVNKLRNERLIARVGEWDTCNNDELYPHFDIEVSNIVVHEEFNPASLFNDVALLTLSQHVEIMPHINPICLPEPEEIVGLDLHNCVATGWGKESFENSRYTNILKEVPLEVVDHYDCQEALRTTRLGKWFQLHETFLCAGGKPHVDTCRGDGGSAIVCKVQSEFPEEEKFVQVGLVAWGIGCGKAGIPGVYADVTKLLPWIHAHLPDEDAYP